MLKVSFHATLRDAAGLSGIELDARSVGELLTAIRTGLGDRLFNMIVKDGKLREDVVILVNGENIVHSKGLEAPLSNGDDVAIFPPVSGG